MEITRELYSGEARNRDQNVRLFQQLSRSQQRMYDSNIEVLEKQTVEMRQTFQLSATQLGQNFNQIVSQLGQKIDGFTAENLRLRAENASRPPPLPCSRFLPSSLIQLLCHSLLFHPLVQA